MVHPGFLLALGGGYGLFNARPNFLMKILAAISVFALTLSVGFSAVINPPWTKPRLFACAVPALIARLTPRVDRRA
jgi:hypothetical protein